MTISIKDFVETYIGKAVDEWGNNRGYHQCFPESATKWCHQCGSLVKYFCKTVYNTPNNTLGDAGSGYDVNNAFFRDYERISNTEIPKRWDIVVFRRDSSNWNYGHIGIVLYADNDLLYFLEQNAGNGDGYWKWGNAIRISVRQKWDRVIWYRRFPGIQKIIKKHEFDDLLYNGAPYIWEATNFLRRSDVAEKIKKYFGKVSWNQERPNDATTRAELAIMISRVSGKNINNIYNWSRPNENVTAIEFTIMMQRWL